MDSHEVSIRKRGPQHPPEQHPRAHELLGERVKAPFYKVEWYVDKGSGERSDPWLIWNPSEDRRASSDHQSTDHQNMRAIVEERVLNLKEKILSPDVLLQSDEYKVFRPRRFYVDSEIYDGSEKRKSKLRSAVDDLMNGELAADGSVPASEIARLRSTREGAWEKLGGYIDDLQNGVLEPLRKALIACLLEQYRDRIGLGNWQGCDHSRRKKWERAVEHAHRLLKELVVRGRRLEVIQKDEHWIGGMSTRLFSRFPKPMAEGIRAALRLYVPRTFFPEEETKKTDPTDYSRNGVLKRAEPVYFKWCAANLMLDSALEDKKLEIGGQDLKSKESEPEDSGTEDPEPEDPEPEDPESEKPDERNSFFHELIEDVDQISENDDISEEELNYVKTISGVMKNYEPIRGAREALKVISTIQVTLKDLLKTYEHKGRVYEEVIEYEDLNHINKASSVGGTINGSIRRRIGDEYTPEGVVDLVNFALVFSYSNGHYQHVLNLRDLLHERLEVQEVVYNADRESYGVSVVLERNYHTLDRAR